MAGIWYNLGFFIMFRQEEMHSTLLFVYFLSPSLNIMFIYQLGIKVLRLLDGSPSPADGHFLTAADSAESICFWDAIW